MDTKSRSLYMLFTRDPPQTEGNIQMESERLEKDISCKWRPKESWRSNAHIRFMYFEIKTMIREQEGHYIMIKGSLQEEYIKKL